MNKNLTMIPKIVALSSVMLFATSMIANAKGPVKIQIGYANNPGEPFDVAVHHWKKLIETQSHGTMKVEVYPSSQLGSKNDLIDQMLAGDSVITLADGAFYADRGVKDMGITFGPYLFDTWKDAWTLTKSKWWQKESKLLEKKGLKLIASNWMYGERHILSKRPIRKVSDLKGLKIRVPSNDIQVEGFKVLGATPTPMPLGDVYTSLQQGTIDALENPLPVLYNGKYHEVAKYLTLSGHVKNFTTFVAGTEFFNTLTPKEKKILISTGEQAGVFNNKLQAKAEAEILAKYKKEGVEIIHIDNKAFAQKAQKFYSLKKFTSQWSPNLYKTVKAASHGK